MITDLEELFFELLQVSIGARKSLSRRLTASDWNSLYTIARKQSLLGITFAGVKQLSVVAEFAETLSRPLYKQWLANALAIHDRNIALNAECEWVCRQLNQDGVQCMLLKGQSNQEYYPENLRNFRNPGDIDVWGRVSGGIRIDGKKHRGIAGLVEYCKALSRSQGREITWDRILYYHCEAMFPEQHVKTEVEMHYRPSYLCSWGRNRYLQQWFTGHAQFDRCWTSSEGHEFPVPAAAFNAVYQLLHLFRHLFEGGIGLRQLLDYYFVVKALSHYVNDFSEINQTLQELGMRRFASAVMFVLQRVFALPDEALLCKADVAEGQFLLAEIMQSGNFGKYDERLKDDAAKGTFRHAWVKLRHNQRLFRHYPEELFWEPFYRIYHWIWRRFGLWKRE